MTSITRLILGAWLWALLGSAWAGGALAQADSAEPPGYRTTIDQALAEYQALHFEEARALFARAHALYPNARTLRGLGMVEFEQRDYATAADYLQRALESGVRPLEGQLREATQDLLARAKLFLAELHLRVQPTDARVTLDGATIDSAQDKPVMVQVGDHVVEVRAAGYEPEQRKLVIKGGEQLTLEIALRPKVEAEAQAAQEASPGTSAAQTAPADAGETTGGPGVWPWVVVGISGAALVAGGVLVAIAVSDVNEVEDSPKGTDWADVQDTYDGTEGTSTAGFVLIGVGAAGVLTGLLWQALDHGGEDAASTALRLQIAPDHVGVAGRF